MHTSLALWLDLEADAVLWVAKLTGVGPELFHTLKKEFFTQIL
jgi:hypothetical protein